MFAANEPQAKAAVSVAEMARMVGLSRARFYQLIGTTFPPPLYTEATRRPFYDEELQRVCLDVRRRNCGVDGKPVLFYSRRPLAAPVPGRKPKKAAAAGDDRHADLLDGLKGLGLVAVTAAHVAEAVKNLYPHGVPEDANGEVLRAVFLHLRRRNSGDKVGR
jgi:predicted DNA-binding transcriptional regulator AlpA